MKRISLLVALPFALSILLLFAGVTKAQSDHVRGQQQQTKYFQPDDPDDLQLVLRHSELDAAVDYGDGLAGKRHFKTGLDSSFAGDGSTTQIARYLPLYATAPACIQKGQLYHRTSDGKVGHCLTAGNLGTWEYFAIAGAVVTSVTATSPLHSSGGATPNITIDDAAADGATKGAASFNAADFNSSAGNVSIDYTNGQSASGAAKGFLIPADWTIFNNKVPTSTTVCGHALSSNVTCSPSDVSLGNVDNTSDVNKPVSTAQAAADALNLKISLNLSDLNNAGTARANLGGTTVGQNVFTAINPAAISFLKVAVDNSVSFRTPAQVASDIGSELAANKDAASGYAGLDASSLLKGAEFPAFTGDATKPSGSLVTTVVKVNGNTPGGTCTNQFARSIDSSGRPTCASVAIGSDVSGLGTGVATAAAVNIGSAGAFITFNGNAGTPSALVCTNCTGTASGLTAGAATNATNASTITKADNVNYFLTFVGANSSSNQAIDVGPATYNPSTNLITAAFSGAHNGTVGATTPAAGSFTTLGASGTLTAVDGVFTPANTTGNGIAFNNSVLTSGNTVAITASGTAAASNTKTALNVATSGANATSAMTTYSAQISNTSTGTTSLNVGLLVSTSGGTNNVDIAFGGATSSFSALKAAGTALDVRLADASQYAVINALGFEVRRVAGRTGYFEDTGVKAVLSFENTGGVIQFNAGDASITRGGVATIQQGAANAASPVAQTYQAQGSRSGTDSNVAGANLTIQSGTGTGNSTGSSLIFNTPVAVASGTGAQTQTATLTLQGGNTTANGTFNAVAAIQLNGTSINTAGTLSNVAYLNASNIFTGTVQSVSAALPDVKLLDTGGNNAAFINNSADVAVIGINRDPATGTFVQTGKAAAQINLTGASSSGIIDFRVSSTNNTLPPVQMSIAGSGAITIAAPAAAGAGATYMCLSTGNVINSGVTCAASYEGKGLKLNLRDVQENQALEWIRAIKPKEFDWNSDPKISGKDRAGKHDIGFSANQLDSVSPLFSVRQDGEVFSVNDRGVLSLNTTVLKNVDARVTQLEAIVAQQQKEIELLRARK